MICGGVHCGGLSVLRVCPGVDCVGPPSRADGATPSGTTAVRPGASRCASPKGHPGEAAPHRRRPCARRPRSRGRCWPPDRARRERGRAGRTRRALDPLALPRIRGSLALVRPARARRRPAPARRPLARAHSPPARADRPATRACPPGPPSLSWPQPAVLEVWASTCAHRPFAWRPLPADAQVTLPPRVSGAITPLGRGAPVAAR